MCLSSSFKTSVSKMKRPGDDPRIGVMEIPRTETYRSRETSQSITGQQVIESKAQADDAVTRISEVGVGANSTSSPIFGILGEVFRAGNTIGSSTGQAMSMDSVKTPPTDLVIPTETFEGPVRKRSLSAASRTLLG